MDVMTRFTINMSAVMHNKYVDAQNNTTGSDICDRLLCAKPTAPMLIINNANQASRFRQSAPSKNTSPTWVNIGATDLMTINVSTVALANKRMLHAIEI